MIGSGSFFSTQLLTLTIIGSGSFFSTQFKTDEQIRDTTQFTIIIDLTLTEWVADVVSDNTKRYLLISSILTTDKTKRVPLIDCFD